jgi:hypothetical protein
VNPDVITTPAQKYSAVAVGDITMEDKLWEYLIPHFRRGLAQGFAEEKAFDAVLDPAPEKLSQSSLLLSGKIIEVDKGSTALRWIVGFGAGKAKVKGVFEIRSCDGICLARFEAQESYAGGAGIGGANLLDMEDLMRRFGSTIAQKAVQWSRGEKVD